MCLLANLGFETDWEDERMKFEGKAHIALAEFARAHPEETFTAVQIRKVVAERGYPGPMNGMIPGDHAIKQDGSSANMKPGCSCSKDPSTAIFLRTEGPGGKWLFSPLKIS